VSKVSNSGDAPGGKKKGVRVRSQGLDSWRAGRVGTLGEWKV
jgi:hypothetical protein